eukprot:484048-Pyramimonas_sp.AAC.1
MEPSICVDVFGVFASVTTGFLPSSELSSFVPLLSCQSSPPLRYVRSCAPSCGPGGACPSILNPHIKELGRGTNQECDPDLIHTQLTCPLESPFRESCVLGFCCKIRPLGNGFGNWFDRQPFRNTRHWINDRITNG